MNKYLSNTMTDYAAGVPTPGELLAPFGLRAYNYGPRGNQWCVSDEYGFLFAEGYATQELAERIALDNFGGAA